MVFTFYIKYYNFEFFQQSKFKDVSKKSKGFIPIRMTQTRLKNENKKVDFESINKSLPMLSRLILPLLVLTSSVLEAYEKAEKSIFHLDEASFSSVLPTGNFLIFFGAHWCPHCQKYSF